MARDSSPGALRVIGFQWSPATHDIKDFLARSRVPYLWMDVEKSAGARGRMEELGVSAGELPLVIFEDGTDSCCPDRRGDRREDRPQYRSGSGRSMIS
jgi:hypothetical protein